MSVPQPQLIEALARLLDVMPDPSSAAQTERLKDELAHSFTVGHAVATSSGTAALHCALAALGVGPGDEVLVPAMSVVMSVAPVVYAGARPVFVDCDPSGTDFDYADLKAKLSKATRCVLPVYLWGRAADPVRLREFADAEGLRVVEDACQAQGTRFDGRLLGTFGDLGCFSTKDGKLLWSGEGGFIVTDDDDLAARCRAFRTHWQTPPDGEAPMSRLGHNYRLSELQAVVARWNLARFEELLARRRHQAELLGTLWSRPSLTSWGRRSRSSSVSSTCSVPRRAAAARQDGVERAHHRGVRVQRGGRKADRRAGEQRAGQRQPGELAKRRRHGSRQLTQELARRPVAPGGHQPGVVKDEAWHVLGHGQIDRCVQRDSGAPLDDLDRI
ncbi:MAG: DegT/DnrJ/EryC1/StrS family aminotransferase [Egibacteraceae bacterium]